MKTCEKSYVMGHKELALDALGLYDLGLAESLVYTSFSLNQLGQP